MRSARAGGGRIGVRLLICGLLLLAASSAKADNCSDYGGVLDGLVVTNPPSQVQIDMNCTVRNYPASNPLRANFSFYQPGPNDEWLVVFDNVVHTGNMSCNSVANHKIWFTNGSSTSIQEGCQNYLIPVEKIDKKNPAGQTAASIGVPFTYELTIPVLFDPADGSVIDFSGSPNELHSVVITDDLNATGVDLSYVSHVAYWEDSGDPVPHSFSNAGGVLTFDIAPIVPAEEQMIIEITVVLDDTLANAPGTQFINTAKWEFGRLIDGTFYAPLPGEWGVTPPMTISVPELVVTKTGPATLGLTINLGEWGEFGVDVLNTGLTDAWNATILDRLPDGATGGMCDVTPQVLSARVFAFDGVTPVAGKGPLISGSDFSLDYDGSPTCELTLTMLTPAGAIGPNERLIITYRAQLDADSQDGAMLTNVVGATEWFNSDSSDPERQSYTRTLTDGTVDESDHQDAHTVAVALYGYFFEKTVANLTSGVSPTTAASPGDTLRYSLRLQATDLPLDDFTFYDDLGDLNASAMFVPGTLALVAGTIPLGADTSNTSPTGGKNGTGILDIRGLSAPANSEVEIQFDITLASTLTDGTVVVNQADLVRGIKIADSDDPNLNGQADPDVAGDEDPTRVVIEVVPPAALRKAITQDTATIGEEFSYLVTVPSTQHTAPLYDVRILDDLTGSDADLQFVGVSKISGPGSWTPVNTGTDTNLVIEDPVDGIDIPAGEQVVLEITVLLLDTDTNVADLTFTNTAAYTYDLVDDDDASARPGDPGTTEPMTIVEPELTLEKSGPPRMRPSLPGSFTLNVHNIGNSPAYGVLISDLLPNQSDGGMCDAAPQQVTAQRFLADGTTPVAPPLVVGTDFTVDFAGDPACTLELAMLSAAAAIGPDERLIVTYEASLDSGTQPDARLTNVAGATRWFSTDVSTPNDQAREYTRTLSDGTVDDLDHEDAHTVLVNLALLRFEKTVENVTRNQDPATLASPGETLHYRLTIENVSDIVVGGFDLVDELDRLNAVPAFQPGTLDLIDAPSDADTSNTDPNGGTNGTGILDIRNLSLGGLGDSLLIEFEIVLAPVIANGSYVTNQSQSLVDGLVIEQSDDPRVGDPPDPRVFGDEDPTRVLIESAPAFRVEKVSTDISGDPDVLLAGETLRYTITVENVGSDDAIDAMLRDAVPVNTSYVAGSTTLNGAAVPDGAGGVAPLSTGIAIYAPGDPSPGSMHADGATGTDVATLVFDVVVDPGVVDGTVISNQAFVSAALGGVFDQPSDDPDTPTPDDPTRDVVGSVPLLFASKSVVIGTDDGSAGVVDPLDILHYTIVVTNNGAVPATGSTLTDAVPADTMWWEDSLRLNGSPVGVPDNGSSPLESGIAIASSDLPAPLPGANGGTLSPGASAVIEFDLQVRANTPSGTLISNQAVVGTLEMPNLLTDGDGNPATGPEPTVVVVGDGQQLLISKQVTVVGGGAALAGGQLEFEVRVTNVATVPAQDVLITDDLGAPGAALLSYTPGSATLDGLSTAVGMMGSVLRADYSGTYGALPPGASTVLRFRADIAANAAIGSTITNTGVVTWNAGSQMASASASIDVGGMPGVGVLNGAVWHDADFDDSLGGGELALAGWSVELQRNGTTVQSLLTDAAGQWSMAGLTPNDQNGEQYELRFTGPGSGANSAALGRADSAFTDGLQQISDIVVTSGSNLQDLNLPIDPNGVVYDALGRTPVAGATLALVAAGTRTPLPSSCFEDPVQQGQVTRGDGYYKFDLNFSSDLNCPSGAGYEIAISMPSAGDFQSGLSLIIPPLTDGSTPPFDVPACPEGPNDAVVATAQHCEVQVSSLAPDASFPARSPETDYHTNLVLETSASTGTSQLFNNHLPVDPVIFGNIAISKTTPSAAVSRGDLVPYEITVRNDLATPIPHLTLVDRYPAGFRYVKGSARVDGDPTDPELHADARELVFTDLGIEGSGTRNVLLLLAVGAGVGDGKFTNRAQAVSSLSGNALSGQAAATVRVVPDADFACTDVIGKVFDDQNRDGTQQKGERGLAGVRLVTARGLVATTDPFGRYHITCAAVPNGSRGSNFILKLDERSLPSGYRMSTRVTQVNRATAGKALRFEFGASIHRVVGLDLADAVFEPGTARLREQWTPRLDRLLEELRNAPATLRLSYVGDLEEPVLVDRRLAAVEAEVARRWKQTSDEKLLVETEIYWRRGAPAGGSVVARLGGAIVDALMAPFRRSSTRDVEPGDATERHLPPDGFTTWAQDPEQLEIDHGDRLEEREVVSEEAETVKLKGVVPPIRFDSGAANIPANSVEELREVLRDDMRDLDNVRLHLVGHADDRPLRASLAAIYGDNEGLSRERAGEVAEFLQAALSLPPEAISYAYAGDSEPVASNATERGREQNRRVEVEIWYDEKREALAMEEVVVSDETKRVKVCRTETVCKLRYRDGHERRARIRNLIAPLHIAEGTARIPDDFVRQVRQALDNLQERQNVTVKFIGYTDDMPLEGRAARIYGTHLAVSKARAHRVARTIQDRLRLPTPAVASDGRGAAFPVASNATERGRALNRRVEVEFWYDDPLQQLPDEPQPCPDPGEAELVTKVYDPPWGRIESISIEDGEPRIPARYADALERALDDIARTLPDATNARLRFVGYTRNERLDRRTASVYGDDVGLSTARARRAMEQVLDDIALAEANAEHEGRGYVHSNDVVNGGFLQGDTDHVAVQVVYDEPKLLDDRDGIDVTPLTRELRAKDPLALNLMHITVDGEPTDDPDRSSADIQRCTDVALDGADIRFEFDGLATRPRLSVTSHPGTFAVPADSRAAVPVDQPAPVDAADPADSGATDPATGASAAAPVVDEASSGSGVQFRMYTNYGHFIERSEVRIFEQGQSVQAEPLAVVEVDEGGAAHWQPDAGLVSTLVRELTFVLRAYDAEGRFDETAPQVLWLVPARAGVQDPGEAGVQRPGVLPTAPDPLLAGYGETGALHRSIPLSGTGAVQVHGSGVPPGHTVWLAGTPVPIDESGNFVAEAVLPRGMHTVEVAVLDPSGSGELFLRDLEFERNDWFYVGIADLTLSTGKTSGPEDSLQGRDSTFDRDSIADGRLAFFLKGRFGEDWSLTAHADTREGPVEDLFKDFVDKTPEALFRRIDSDYFYPTFGDDGTVEEAAPTSGKFFVKLSQRENHAMWGNFKVGYLENELAQVDRGLYGANVHYQTLATTRFGERRVVLDGFAAQPGTVPSREDFRGTGGSLYYLKVQDLLEGSERLRIETRDKDSGLVTGVVSLRPTLDYDIDYLQGRVLLSEPLSATQSDGSLVRSEGIDGDEVWLVVQYEYTPGLDDLDALAAGGQGHAWLNDFVRVGATASRNDDDGTDSSLYAGDLILRASADSWLKLQYGRSDGIVSTSLRSEDGGFNFIGAEPFASESAEANGYRADLSVAFADLLPDGWGRGRLSLYGQMLDSGYSAPGLLARNDTQQYGGVFELPITEQLRLYAKGDRSDEEHGLDTATAEIDISYALNQYWSVSTGVRYDRREDDSPVVPVTQDAGERVDSVVQVGFDSGGAWNAYAFGQSTLVKSDDRDDNERYGVGGAFRIGDRLVVDGEVSYGESGPALTVGTSYQESDEMRRYMSYAVENERGIDGRHQRRGNLVSGVRARFSDSGSVFVEDRFQHSGAQNGLIRAMGLTLSPSERWSFTGSWELGTLIDRQTNAETERNAGGISAGYRFDKLQLSTNVEYRNDDSEQLDGSHEERTTWLFRGNLKYQMTPDWRVLGKVSYSTSDSSEGSYFDGGYTEAILGYAFRPVKHDRLNALAKYTYFSNMPTTDQFTTKGIASLFIQRSHVASFDVSYDLTPEWSVGGKYAYRRGEVSLDRVAPDFFANDAHLVIMRMDYRFWKDWEVLAEGRMLDLTDLDELRSGALLSISRYLGEHLKVGIGYNFTDFSEDLTDLSYDHHGFFFNITGSL
jgi:uncharacterized repeat protein (TIGR01451 family)